MNELIWKDHTMTRISKKNAIIIITLLSLVLSGAVYAQEKMLIIRGDDLGMTQGSLVAFEQAFNNGILTAASVMVPTPWFEGAAELCRKNPGWCTGIHLMLVGEWRGYKTRPVLPWSKISSMVDEDGYLYTYPDELWEKNPKLKEIDAEFRAQIDLALKKGINVQYIDTHYMHPSSVTHPGLKELLIKIGEDYDIPVSMLQGEDYSVRIYSTPIDEKLSTAIKSIEDLKPGLNIWVCHPGIDSPEHGALIHANPDHIMSGGGVGKHRAEVLNVLKSIELKSAILKNNVKLVSYQDLWDYDK